MKNKIFGIACFLAAVATFVYFAVTLYLYPSTPKAKSTEFVDVRSFQTEDQKHLDIPFRVGNALKCNFAEGGTLLIRRVSDDYVRVFVSKGSSVDCKRLGRSENKSRDQSQAGNLKP